VHVIAEPSKMSHILQALDNSSAFGRYQPKVRPRVREIALECRDAGTQFNTPELMRCIARTASDALTKDALRTAFRRVGMWPLDPTVVIVEELSKGADAPVTSVNLELLTRRLIPIVRKDSVRPRVVNGTLSTAGRGTLLTAPEVIAALAEGAAAKEAAKVAKDASKRAREKKAEEKKILAAAAARAKRFKLQQKEDEALQELWTEIAQDSAHEGACRLRAMGMVSPSAAKLRRRALASRVRLATPPPMLVWRFVSAQCAQAAERLSR